MIPSTLAAEVSGALRDFLSTGFGPSTPALSDVVKDFLDDSDNLLKGPYLSVDLPFQRAPEGGEPFPETPLDFTPYRHQRTAFDRLTGGRGEPTMHDHGAVILVPERERALAVPGAGALGLFDPPQAWRYRRTNFSTCWAVPCRPISRRSGSFPGVAMRVRARTLEQPNSPLAMASESRGSSGRARATRAFSRAVWGSMPHAQRSGEVLLCAQGLYNSSAMTNIYAWDPDKNARLSAEWGLSFEQIVAEIEMHGVLDDVENPNPAYPHQRVLFVAVDGYAVAVPYVTDGETKFLKTAFHSRRATRIYLGG